MQQAPLDQIADGAGERQPADQIGRALEQLASQRRKGQQHRVFAQDHGEHDPLHFLIRGDTQ